MIKAEQLSIIQSTNAFVANNIREQELSFYSKIYRSLGVIAITMVGFTTSSLQQVTSTGYDTSHYTAKVYFVLITIAILFSVHLSMTTMYAYVYGNNMAIRGQDGSMVTALNGLLRERRTIITLFILMVIFLIFSTAATNWVVMTHQTAFICSCIMVMSSLVTWRSCLRIYNRSQILNERSHDILNRDQKPSPLLEPLLKDSDKSDLGIDGEEKFDKKQSWYFSDRNTPKRRGHDDDIINDTESVVTFRIDD